MTTAETTSIPNTNGFDPIGGKAKEIKATDGDGNSITNLSSNATIELSYLGSELYGSFTGITLEDIRHLQIFYYDQTTLSWIPLPSTIESSVENLFESYTGSTLLSDVPGYASINFTLKATTDHFTLFTSLVSTAVNSSSGGSG